MESEIVISCLFCTFDCNSSDVQDTPKGDGDHNENIPTPDLEEEDADPAPLLFQEDPAIREQLKAYFILSKILKIPNESLCKFLSEKNGHSKLEFWAKVCGACGPLVRQFFDTFKQISKLERILVGIEGELKGKVIESKNKEVEGQTAHIIKHIRTQLLEQHALNSNGEYSEVNLADYLIQDWNIYEKNERGGLKDTRNVRVTTISTDNHDEGQGGDIHKRKKRSRSRSSSLSKTAKENSEPEKKRLKDSKPGRFLPVDDDDGNYECDMCVYKTDDASDFTFHIEALHEANCGMFRCPNCFAFLSPSEKESHRNLCQPHLARHPGTEKKLGEELTKGETRNLNLSKPYYISFRQGKFNGWQYQCRNCPYETLHLSRIQAHIQIHGEIFSGEAIACEKCGWHMLPKYLDAHQTLNHPEEYESDSPAQNSGSNESVRKNRKKLKCFKCPYETSKRIRLEAHLKIHVEGSQAAPCKVCGWYLLPNAANRHRNYCHGQGVR